jgi:hypothetical protein
MIRYGSTGTKLLEARPISRFFLLLAPLAFSAVLAAVAAPLPAC